MPGLALRSRIRIQLQKYLPDNAVSILREFNRKYLMNLWLPVPYFKGVNWARTLKPAIDASLKNEQDVTEVNPLQAHFDSIKEGPGIWKWEHYFDIYHRHLNKFVNKKVYRTRM